MAIVETVNVRPLWVDGRGYELSTSFSAPSTSAGIAVVGVMQGYSTAICPYIRATHLVAGPAAPQSPGTYPSVGDVADIRFRGDRGSSLHVLIPAPVNSLFLGDHETVDPAAIADLISYAVTSGYIRTPSGGYLTDYVAGVRRTLFQRRPL